METALRLVELRVLEPRRQEHNSSFSPTQETPVLLSEYWCPFFAWTYRQYPILSGRATQSLERSPSAEAPVCKHHRDLQTLKKQRSPQLVCPVIWPERLASARPDSRLPRLCPLLLERQNSREQPARRRSKWARNSGDRALSSKPLPWCH